MSVWDEYLTLAHSLSLNQSSEACQRSTTSRAYYAAYCLTRNHLIEKRVIPDDRALQRTLAIGHQPMWALLLRSSDPAVRKIGLQGDRMRERRNRADYQNVIRRVEDEMYDTLEDAALACEEIKKLGRKRFEDVKTIVEKATNDGKPLTEALDDTTS